MADGTYEIPVPLVTKAIYSILAAILALGLYMVVWAINDAEFKGEMRALLVEVRQMRLDVDRHSEKPCHDVACERLRTLDRNSEVGH